MGAPSTLFGLTLDMLAQQQREVGHGRQSGRLPGGRGRDGVAPVCNKVLDVLRQLLIKVLERRALLHYWAVGATKQV